MWQSIRALLALYLVKNAAMKNSRFTRNPVPHLPGNSVSPRRILDNSSTGISSYSYQSVRTNMTAGGHNAQGLS